MAAQFRAVLHLRLFRVPDPEGAVDRAGCDEVAGWVPGDGADSGVLGGGAEVSGDGGWFRGRGEWVGGMAYVWDPGPRVEGSWYVWVLRVEKAAAKWSLGRDFRGEGGAIWAGWTVGW